MKVYATQGTTVEVYQHGAHVTSWKSSTDEVSQRFFLFPVTTLTAVVCSTLILPVQELLFLSKQAVFKPPKAIRYAISEAE